MSRRNNTKVDYKALHEGRKPPSSEDSMINVSHDNDLDASIAQLTMKLGRTSEGGDPDCPPPRNRKTKGRDRDNAAPDGCTTNYQ